MNKVLNIDIAGQVFRLDEVAFDKLTNYLEQIRKQLRGFDGAEEILKDIELRIAELLFQCSADSKAISAQQVEEVIEQVGLIDSDSQLDEEITRRSFRDEDNKILAGVCAGLATRFQVPAIILRLVFIVLTPLFGLGAALYLIFWISLQSNGSRNTALAALGKPRTAKQLALYDGSEPSKPVASFFGSLQRVVFLPVSLIGALLSVIATHFESRKNSYKNALKFLFTGVLVILSGFAIALFFAFENARFVPWLFNTVIGIAVAYLLVLAWAIYLRRYFFQYSDFAVSRELKLGAAAPIAILALTFVFLFNSLLERDRQIVERDYPIAGNNIDVVFDRQQHEEDFNGHAQITFRTKTSDDDRLSILLDYGAAGRSLEHASDNLEGIDYAFSFSNNTLTLADHFTLKDGFYNRAHRVTVVVEVPQYTSVTSPRSFSIRQLADTYDYIPRIRAFDSGATYIAQDEYFHEMNEDFRNRLSSNEREVLQDKFCKEFFISQSWNCVQNIRTPVQRNSQFDLAFQSDTDTVEQLRNFMSPNRSLFVSNLADVSELVNSLSVNYEVTSGFQAYVNHLIQVKSI